MKAKQQAKTSQEQQERLILLNIAQASRDVLSPLAAAQLTGKPDQALTEALAAYASKSAQLTDYLVRQTIKNTEE